MKITYSVHTVVILAALIILLWWLCRRSEEPDPPGDETKIIPYLTDSEASQWSRRSAA